MKKNDQKWHKISDARKRRVTGIQRNIRTDNVDDWHAIESECFIAEMCEVEQYSTENGGLEFLQQLDWNMVSNCREAER